MGRPCARCPHGMHETGTGSYTREITHSIDLLFCSMSVCRPAGTVFHSPHARIYTQVMVILMVIVAGSIPFPHACAGSIGFLLSLSPSCHHAAPIVAPSLHTLYYPAILHTYLLALDHHLAPYSARANATVCTWKQPNNNFFF